MRSTQFGKVLRFDFDTLRKKLANRALFEELNAHLAVGVIRKLERGSWDTLKYHQLHSLICLAEFHQVRPLISLVDSPIWATFRNPSAKTHILVGTNLRGDHVDDDSQLVTTLTSAFATRYETVDAQDGDRVRALMETTNVATIGGAKVNYGTEIALEKFIDLGAPRIVFRWPQYSREGRVVGGTRSENRSLQIGDEVFEESRGDTPRLLGIVAFCRRPAQVTTVVISGCSREATKEMHRDLDAPYFYRHIDMSWTRVDKPIVFLYDSAAAPRWRAVNIRKPTARPGRPRGRPNSGPRPV